jgi:hypothetical protein
MKSARSRGRERLSSLRFDLEKSSLIGKSGRKGVFSRQREPDLDLEELLTGALDPREPSK